MLVSQVFHYKKLCLFIFVENFFLFSFGKKKLLFCLTQLMESTLDKIQMMLVWISHLKKKKEYLIFPSLRPNLFIFYFLIINKIKQKACLPLYIKRKKQVCLIKWFKISNQFVILVPRGLRLEKAISHFLTTHQPICLVFHHKERSLPPSKSFCFKSLPP